MHKLAILCFLFLTSCYDSREEKYGQIEFITQEGISVAPNGYPIPPDEFQEYTSRVLLEWQGFLDQEGVDCNLYDHIDQLMVSFTTLPFYHPRYPDLPLAGISIVTEDVTQVGWRDSSTVEHSALGHEYGHFILWYCNQPYGESALEEWHNKYGVPF